MYVVLERASMAPRLRIHKYAELCLCNYAFVSDSFIAGFCVGVGLRGWVRALAAQISHSIENASFSFPLLNHCVSSFSSLHPSHPFPRLPSPSFSPNYTRSPRSPFLPSSFNSSYSHRPPSIPVRRCVNMASPSSWICVAPSGTASNLF